jgi:hypothetical protein
MGIEHVNRAGDTYYLQAKTTKTGKTSYSFTKKKRPESPVE